MSHRGLNGWAGVEAALDEKDERIRVLTKALQDIAACPDSDSVVNCHDLMSDIAMLALMEGKQMCMICGTTWTADEVLPCPTPGKHPAEPMLTYTRADSPELFRVIDET